MSSQLLSRALLANATFSALTGLVLTAGASPLSDWLGIPVWTAIVVGLGLLPFAVLVARVARRPLPSAVRAVILADLSWVAGAIVIVAWPGLMSVPGRWALGLVTVGVADFAVLQWLGLRRSPEMSRVSPAGGVLDARRSGPRGG